MNDYKIAEWLTEGNVRWMVYFLKVNGWIASESGGCLRTNESRDEVKVAVGNPRVLTEV